MTQEPDGMISTLKVAPRRRPLDLVIIAAVMIGLAAVVLVSWTLKQKQADAIEDTYWSLNGARCPSSDAQTLRGARPPMAATFEGAKFERRSGFIECVRHRYDLGKGRRDYPVCQFSSPQVVGVTVGAVETFFAQPTGRSLRIAIADGKPICVLIDRLPMK
ncbi:hypothetical protein [Caulobacter sp.]|uniref:hypothetical protein n=1 Tax=Caulobacter sp. TaxID=78 RepID=UPI003BAA9A30